MDLSPILEEAKKLEIILDEVVKVIGNKITYVKTEVQSSVTELENVRLNAEKRVQAQHSYDRDVESLNQQIHSLKETLSNVQIEQQALEQSISRAETNIATQQTNFLSDKNKLERLQGEKRDLDINIAAVKQEITQLDTINKNLQPKYENDMKQALVRNEQLKREKDLLSFRIDAIRRLCKQNYIQSSEIDILKFFATRPTTEVTLNDLKTSLPLPQDKMQRILRQLYSRGVIDYNPTQEIVKILVKIDLWR